MKNILILFLLVMLAACTKKTETSNESEAEGDFIEYNNPAAEGFDQEGSDLLATLIADKSMLAMGGREAWDKTRYIGWNFFGRRDHLWDKWTGNVRIEVPEQELTILMNINTKEGKVQKNGEILTDSAEYYLQRGYGMWVNDSYWLVMPYKLKDSGVTLKYLREDTTQVGSTADVLSLSFKEVGITPQNIYEVWVDTDSKLVTQWAYFPDSSSLDPQFITPWADYQKYGEILLSSDRGQYKLTGIDVFDEVEERLFSSFD